MQGNIMIRLRNHISLKRATLLTAIVIGIISFAIFSRDLSSYSFYHGDEGFWIETGKWTVQKFLIERDFSQEQWWSKELRSFGAVNPNFGKLIIGGSLCINQHCHFSGLPKWDFSQPDAWNIKEGHAAPSDELAIARSAIVLTTALSAIVLFTTTVITARWSLLAGIFACIAFLSHPLVVTLGRQVMLDMPAILFSLLAISITYKSLISNTDKYTTIWFFLTALCSGLAISTKLNAGLILITIIIIGIINALIHRNSKAYLFLAINVIIPPLIFLALNPQLWPNVLNGIKAMWAFNQSIADRRTIFTRDALWTISDQLFAYYQRIPQNLLHLSLYILGFILMIKDMKTTWPMLVYGLVSSLGVIIWTPLNWDRYYLPGVPFYALAIGFLIANMKLFLNNDTRNSAVQQS